MELLQKKAINEVTDTIYLKALESKFLHQDNLNNLDLIMSKRNQDITKYQRKKVLHKFGSGSCPHHKPYNIEALKKIGISTYEIPDEYNELMDKLLKYLCYKKR